MRTLRRRLLQSSLSLGLAPAALSLRARQAPRSAFSARSTAEEVTEGLDLSGKVALITGCNSGIGYETMRVLALRGALVFGTARSDRKGREACESVPGDARPLLLELTNFDSVVECAGHIAELDKPLDMLICNAGVLLPERERVNGIEKQFVVNHLGLFLLVNRLLDQVRAAPQGRVVARRRAAILRRILHLPVCPEIISRTAIQRLRVR